jgi:uncharacterized RmlC-like cupin family protein
MSEAIGEYKIIHGDETVHTSDHGLMREWGISGESAGSEHISMAVGIVPPGKKSKRHYHPFETAIYVINGKARAYFGPNDEEYTDVNGGDFVFIPANVWHSTENIGDGPIQYILARAAPEEVAYDE